MIITPNPTPRYSAGLNAIDGFLVLDKNINGTYTQAGPGGQVKQMSTLSLKAETVGSSDVAKGDGMQINTNNGTASTLLVTQVHDLNAVLPNADGFTTYQNVPAIIAVRGNGTTIQGLLDNDHVSNAPNALIKLTGVSNAEHYKDRSCSRSYLLGCSTKAYLKTAEISIANLDIGFVNAGQQAEVKLETFPYTKYGTVKARVDMVTADAVTDEKKGSYYPATLTLAAKDMNIDGKRVPISPGMNITAEIKTGQRRVIEYLLSTIQRAGSESLRER